MSILEAVWKQSLYKRRLYVICGARLRTDILDNRSLAMLLEISKGLIYQTLVSGQPLSVFPTLRQVCPEAGLRSSSLQHRGANRPASRLRPPGRCLPGCSPPSRPADSARCPPGAVRPRTHRITWDTLGMHTSLLLKIDRGCVQFPILFSMETVSLRW